MKISSFRNTPTYRKLWAGVPSTSPLYHGGSMNLRVRPRVKNVLWISNKLQLFVKHVQIWGGCEGGYKEAKKSDTEVCHLSDIKSQTPHPLINTFFFGNSNSMSTLYRIAFAPPRKSYRIGLLFTHKNVCGSANSVKERSCAKLISKAKRQISDRVCAIL